MSALQIAGGIVTLFLAILLIITITAQEGKSGMGALTGSNDNSGYDAARGARTRQGFLLRITKILAVSFAVVTLLLNMVISFLH